FGRQVYIVRGLHARSWEEDSRNESVCLDHMNDGQGNAALQRHLKAFDRNVASRLKELHAREGGSHLIACKPCSTGRGLTGIKKHGANATPCPVRMNKECADLRRVCAGIK